MADRESARLFYQFVLWRVTEQSRDIESIEGKVNSTVALCGVVVLLFVGSVAFGYRPTGAASVEPASVSAIEVALIAIVVGLLALSIAFALLAHRTQQYKAGPRLDQLEPQVSVDDEEKLLTKTARALVKSEQENAAAIKKKGTFANYSLIAAMSSIALIVAFVLAFHIPW